MKRIILLTSLCLASASASVLAAPAAPEGLLVDQSDTTPPDMQPTLPQQRDERIQQNTERRTTNREQRREGAANAAGMPGLDRGIQRRNERRENRRDELRTGQPAQPPPQQ